MLQITSALLTVSATAICRFISARVMPLELVVAKGVSVCPSGRLLSHDVSSFLRLNFRVLSSGAHRERWVLCGNPCHSKHTEMVYSPQRRVYPPHPWLCTHCRSTTLLEINCKLSSAIAQIARERGHYAVKTIQGHRFQYQWQARMPLRISDYTNLHPTSHRFQVIEDYWSNLHFRRGLPLT